MALRVDSLTVLRGERTILDGIEFAAAPGEAVTLVGPNGAGKTTLLRTLAGLITPASGRIDLSLGDTSRTVAERCHFVGHQNALRPALTVAENARFWLDYLGGPEAGVETALAELDLSALATIPAGYLSAGQKRRLGLVRLLLAPRTLWLLDEPTVSLDTASRERLARIADAHLAGGGILVAATHQPLGLESSRELALGRGAMAS